MFQVPINEVQASLFTFKIDLGQIIIALLIAIVGFFVKKTINDFGRRIDKHDQILFRTAQDIQFIIGAMGLAKRRQSQIEHEQ